MLCEEGFCAGSVCNAFFASEKLISRDFEHACAESCVYRIQMQINLLSGSIFAIPIIMAWQHKSVLDEPLQWFLVGFGGGAFGDACILKFTAGSSELRWDGQPAVAAVSCSSFGQRAY